MALRPKKSFPLRMHLSTLFVILMLAGCGAISLLFYTKSRDMVADEATNLVQRITGEYTRELERLAGPPETLVNLLAFSSFVQNESLEERLTGLPVMREAMLANQNVASIYLGYPNGEFFQFRRLRDQADRAAVGAPDQAVWAVQSIDVLPDQRVDKQFLFFNQEMERVGARVWDTTYDPRQRGWYRQAVDTAEAVRGSPYLFFTDQQIGMTFARSHIDKRVVAGADIRLDSLSRRLTQDKVTPRTQVVLFESSGELIAHEDVERLVLPKDNAADELMRRRIDQMGNAALDELHKAWLKDGFDEAGMLSYEAGGEPWLATLAQLKLNSGPPVYFGMAIPYLELTAEVRQIRNQTALLALALVLGMVPLTMAVARWISKPIAKLAEEADAVRRLDFSDKGRIRSIVKEVDNLSGTMSFMRKTISEFLLLIESLNREKNFDTLLERIGNDVRHAAAADGVLICLVDYEREVLSPDVYCDKRICSRDLDLPEFGLDSAEPIVGATLRNERTRWDLDRSKNQELAVLFGENHPQATVWCEPLEDRQGNSMGIIGLVYHGPPEKAKEEDLRDRLLFVQRLSGLAGVTLETKQLIKKQKELFDAFIKLIAGAIDAKSPYTGGHCQRVPVIAKMLAQAACDTKDGPLADFDLTEEQWEELHVAAWLHDCGKVTTPEYVVDKATKLETIYDRIHEVRMRFEVLKRDAEIACWQAITEGGARQESLDALQQRLAQLDDDYRFIAHCNEGGEFLADEAIERLRQIAGLTWQRTLDDRIGISWEEGKRKAHTSAADLPAEEALLSDREEHLIGRGEADHIEPGNPWGFKVEEPENLYNRGELYNLEVKRGTLSQEERYKINDHIVQTIKMLEELPYPRHLKDVPEIAGGHHESMTGTGYPRRLKGEQMSLTARMMVIADVFEALTASDRPYKKAKKLSDAIRIMSSMQKGGHFDPELYRLFLTSGIYRQYGEQYLDPDQVDEVQIEEYLEG